MKYALIAVAILTPVLLASAVEAYKSSHCESGATNWYEFATESC